MSFAEIFEHHIVLNYAQLINMYSCVGYFVVFRNKMTYGSKLSLFENHDEQLSESDVCSYLDEGRLYLAKHAREKGLYTEALKLLNCVNTPEASFQIALVYFLINCCLF